MLDETDRWLLNQLGHLEYRGGDNLGNQKGISRVAVSKRFSRLRKLGVPIESAPGKGYRLAADGSLLSEHAVRSYLSKNENAKLLKVEIHTELGSTNLRAAQLGSQPGKVNLVLAESQPAGQGRGDRRWISSPWRNLTGTLTWQMPHWPPNLPAVSLLSGLIAAQALELAGVPEVQIKWPNDIFLGAGKLGGILVNARGEANGECELMIGIGINHAIADLDARRIDQPWVDLRSQGFAVDRNHLAALLLQGFIQYLPLFEKQGFEPFSDEWNRRARYRGQQVQLIKKLVDEPIRQMGQASLAYHPVYLCLGADTDGSLMLQGASGLVRLRDAEYSLRPVG